MAGDRPLVVLEKMAVETGVAIDPRSLLFGYLFGRAACEDGRLLTDNERLRAFARPLLVRLP